MANAITGNLLLVIIVLIACGMALELAWLLSHPLQPIPNSISNPTIVQPTAANADAAADSPIQHIQPIIISDPPVHVPDTREQHSISSAATYSSLHLDKVLDLHAVPPIVQAWRQARLDWHDLLPSHNSKWERYGTPKKEGKLRMLVGKEQQVTDYLTQYEESGLSSIYGHDHGPLTAYAGCNAFHSPCVIHTEAECISNELCEWFPERMLCSDISTKPEHPSACSRPMIFTPKGPTLVSDASRCKGFIQQPIVLIALDAEAQTMFYHFWAAWQHIYRSWLEELAGSRQVHFVLKDISDPMFLHYFGLLSDYCWRRMASLLHGITGLCFCKVKLLRVQQIRMDPIGAAQQMVDYLQLQDVKPPSDRAKVGLVSRRRKRFILNEYQLVQSLEQQGYAWELLPLESMTLYEQLRSLRSLHVLVGIHGSALENSIFLQPHSVLLHLLPFSVEHRVTFKVTAEEAGIVYQEWQASNATLSVFHWDLLQQVNENKLKRVSKQEVLAQGQSRADNRETTMFWINQDLIVPLDAWRNMLAAAVHASPAVTRVPSAKAAAS